MTEYRTILERDLERIAHPAGFTLDDLGRRRDRKRRNQRIAAGVVGIAVFVAAMWIVTSGAWFDRSETVVPAESGSTGPAVTEPTYTLGPVTPKDIATGESFMDVWVDGDGEAAAAMFAPGGTFDGFQPGVLPALHDWFRAEGWTFSGTADCGIHGWGPRRGVVGCEFTYENDLTRALGMPPVDTTLSFVIDAGGIRTAWFGAGGDMVFDMFAGYRGHPTNDVLGPVWQTFIDWISSRHPEDFGRMHDSDRGYPILDATSIGLWKHYTGEFVASPQAQAMARSIRDAGWDGVGIPPEGMAPSTPEEGRLVAQSFEGYGPIFAYVYADGRVIAQERGHGFLTERRLTPEGVDLVRSGDIQARDLLGLASVVPADAWEDPEIKPFVPSRYAVCYWMAKGNGNPGTINNGYEYPSTVLGFLPPQARDILRGDLSHGEVGIDDPSSSECSEVTTDEARALEQILSDVRVEDSEGDEIILEFEAILPHGVKVGYCSPNPCG